MADRKFAPRITPGFNSISPDINNNNKVKIRTVTDVFLEGEWHERENFAVYLRSHNASITPIPMRHCTILIGISMSYSPHEWN